MKTQETIHPYTFIGLTDYGKKIFRNRLSAIKESTPDNIINNLSALFDVKKEILLSTLRTRKVVTIRCLAIREIRANYPRMTLSTLGKIFNRDHSTVIYNLQQYDSLLKYDHDFQEMVRDYTEFVKLR